MCHELNEHVSKLEVEITKLAFMKLLILKPDKYHH